MPLHLKSLILPKVSENVSAIEKFPKTFNPYQSVVEDRLNTSQRLMNLSSLRGFQGGKLSKNNPFNATHATYRNSSLLHKTKSLLSSNCTTEDERYFERHIDQVSKPIKVEKDNKVMVRTMDREKVQGLIKQEKQLQKMQRKSMIIEKRHSVNESQAAHDNIGGLGSKALQYFGWEMVDSKTFNL